MEFIVSRVLPLFVTVVMLFAAMAVAVLVGNLSGALLRKFFGIGGK